MKRLVLAALLALLPGVVLAQASSPPAPKYHPGYASNLWYPPIDGSLNSTSTAVAAIDTIYCEPAVIRYDGGTIKTLGIRTSAAGSSAKVKLAVYNNSATTHRAATLLGNTAEISISGTTDQTAATSSTIALGPGIYWFCSLWTWSSAPTATHLSTGGSLEFSGKVGGDTLQHAISSSLLYGTSYTTSGLYASGFPSSLSGLTTDTAAVMPVVGWQQN